MLLKVKKAKKITSQRQKSMPDRHLNQATRILLHQSLYLSLILTLLILHKIWAKEKSWVIFISMREIQWGEIQWGEHTYKEALANQKIMNLLKNYSGLRSIGSMWNGLILGGLGLNIASPKMPFSVLFVIYLRPYIRLEVTHHNLHPVSVTAHIRSSVLFLDLSYIAHLTSSAYFRICKKLL